MAILVTGTPGTGKSVIAKRLAKLLNYTYLDVNKIIRKNKIYDNYDKKRRCYVVDEKKLAKTLVGFIKNNNKIVIDSHLSHFVPPRYVEYCIVTKCSLKKLKNRLEKRNYHAAKVRENLDSEIFDTCLVEARDLKHRIKIIDTTKKISDKELRKIIKEKIIKNG